MVVLTILTPVLVSLSPSHLLRVGKPLGLAALILVPIELLATHLVPLCWQALRWPTTRNFFCSFCSRFAWAPAALAAAVELSLALGAFAAGLMVSASPFAHRALDQMWPLRDAFVAIFFVTGGVLINPRNILAYPHVLLTILLLVISWESSSSGRES